MRRRRLCRPTPCRQPEAPKTHQAKAAKGPQLRLALAMLDAQASALQAKWGHGVGRHARQMRGEIVSTCKNLRVRSRSLRVQTGLYPPLYPIAATFLLHLRKHTAPCVDFYWSILGAPVVSRRRCPQTLDWSFQLIVLCQKPHLLVWEAPASCVKSPTP